MESFTTIIEKLIEKAEIYSKTTFELYKYKAVYKLADIFSDLVVKLVIIIVVVLFFLFANIGLALFLGQYFVEVYYGFFIVAFGYLFVAFLIYIFRKNVIKNQVSNFIINKFKNEELS